MGFHHFRPFSICRSNYLQPFFPAKKLLNPVHQPVPGKLFNSDLGNQSFLDHFFQHLAYITSLNILPDSGMNLRNACFTSCCASNPRLLKLLPGLLASTYQVKSPWQESFYIRLYRDHPPFLRPSFRHSIKYPSNKTLANFTPRTDCIIFLAAPASVSR